MVGLVFCFEFLGFFESFSFLFSGFPYFFCVFKGPEFNAFGDVNFVNFLQSKVCINDVEKVEFVFCDKWVFYVRAKIRENTNAFRLGSSFVFWIS